MLQTERMENQNRRNRSVIIVICTMLLSSCAYKGAYYGGRRAGSEDPLAYPLAVLAHGYRSNSTVPTNYALAMILAEPSSQMENMSSKSEAYKEAERIWKKRQKIVADSVREIPLAAELQRRKEELQRGYEERVRDRLLFLQDFYTGLYSLDSKAFTQRYKNNCTPDLQKRLSATYRMRTGKKGNFWVYFTDNELHAGKDFLFSYLDGNPEKVVDKDDALYMWGDSVKSYHMADPELEAFIARDSARSFLADFRFTDMEDKWYKVMLGNRHVYVQIYGEKDHIMVSGLINPYMNIRIQCTGNP